MKTRSKITNNKGKMRERSKNRVNEKEENKE